LPKKKSSLLKQAKLRGMFKKASWSVCTATIVVSPDPSSPSVPNSSIVKLHKAPKRTLMTVNQQLKEISYWNTPLITCSAQV
jgi:hypothetical protein